MREGMGSAPIFYPRKQDLNHKKQGLSASSFWENVICYTLQYTGTESFKVLMKDLLKERDDQINEREKAEYLKAELKRVQFQAQAKINK